MKFINGKFISTTGKTLSVIAKQTKAGRWQYRHVSDKKLIASGMTPRQFAKEFWFTELIEDSSEIL